MNFSATLLTGGKSTRMGQDKASLAYLGGRLWEHQIRTLQNAGAAEILISGPLDGVYQNSGYRIVPDEYPERGPIEGLRCTLIQATYGHVLLLAIDLPRMSAEYLTALWSKCLPGCGVVARDRAYEPLAAFYPREILQLLEKHICTKEYSFQKLIAAAELLGVMTPCVIAENDLDLFSNWNFQSEI